MNSRIAQSDAPVLRDGRAVVLMIAASLTVMTAATISPALPGLEHEFGVGGTASILVRMLVPAPSLAVVLAAGWCGGLADRWGRRPMMLWGSALFILSGSAGLVLPTLELILVSRLCLGIALAMIMTAQTALMGDYFSGRALHAVSGYQVAARNLGGFVFVIIAGTLASVTPRLPFLVYALPVLALPLFHRAIVEPDRTAPPPMPGNSGHAQNRPDVVRLLALGQLVLTVLFFTMPTQLPFFLAARDHASPAMTGSALGALMLSGGAAAMAYPRFRAAAGTAMTWCVGLGLMAAGFCILSRGSQAAVLAGSATIGAGYALAIPGFVALSMAHTAPPRRGRTGALMTGSVFLGQFLSPIISTPAIALWGWNNSIIGVAVALGAASAAAACVAALRRIS